VFESQVHFATVTEGLNQTISYLHTCRRGLAALVYNLMEPLRLRADPLV
jgi:CRISPR/Cas system-associated endonuclease Cas1